MEVNLHLTTGYVIRTETVGPETLDRLADKMMRKEARGDFFLFSDIIVRIDSIAAIDVKPPLE